MDTFAMTSVREVFTKRGVAVDHQPALMSSHISSTVTKLPTPAQWSDVTLLHDSDFLPTARPDALKSTSVGYLFGSAVKHLKSVGLFDSRIHGWSPESFVWRLPELAVTSLNDTSGKGARGQSVVGGAFGRNNTAHVLAK